MPKKKQNGISTVVQASGIATRGVPNPQFHQGQTHHIGLLGEDVVGNGDKILEMGSKIIVYQRIW